MPAGDDLLRPEELCPNCHGDTVEWQNDDDSRTYCSRCWWEGWDDELVDPDSHTDDCAHCALQTELTAVLEWIDTTFRPMTTVTPNPEFL